MGHRVFDDLETEYEAFDRTLRQLEDEQWAHPSLCEGWDVRDVVCHLWIQSEVALRTIEADVSAIPLVGAEELPELDQLIDDAVKQHRDVPGDEVWRRWQEGRAQVVQGLRELPRDARVSWTISTMSPPTLATTLLMEAWAHAYDIRSPLGLPQELTPGTRHVAWFVLQTLPFAFEMAGEPYEPVRFELEAPGGETWRLGPDDAADVVRGSALELCLRGVDRLDLADAETLTGDGAAARTALRVMRAFP